VRVAVQDLATKRLVLFTGKGGVGKTTCSAAAALRFARAGKRTLLVTVDPAKRLEDALGVPVGFTATPVEADLTAMMLDPATVIREHLQREVPQAKVEEHPLFRYVTSSLPGLNEMMAIGRLNDLRREDAYDVIVVDTAPTGHALSFLGVPKSVSELMSETSLLHWAVKGYTVWQRLSATARGVGNVFKKAEDRRPPPPDIDFQRLFGRIRDEAERIRAFLADPKLCAVVVVTIPERLPVEETVDLHTALTKELGMRVHTVVVNKVQPDPLGPHDARFAALAATAAARRRFTATAARATGEDPALVEAMVEGAEFGRVRRRMNLEHIADLRRRLPEVPLVQVPLFKEDVQGIPRLGPLADALFSGT
jgi:arsenite/tail-anchored protein-transporting ATPase